MTNGFREKKKSARRWMMDISEWHKKNLLDMEDIFHWEIPSGFFLQQFFGRDQLGFGRVVDHPVTAVA